MTAADLLPGFSLEFRAVAWFRAWLRATHTGDARLALLAANELRALGVIVEPAEVERVIREARS